MTSLSEPVINHLTLHRLSYAVSVIENVMQELRDYLIEVGAKREDLDALIDGLNARCETMRTNLEKLKKRATEPGVEAKIDFLDVRIDAVDSQLAKLNDERDEINATFKALDSVLDEIDVDRLRNSADDIAFFFEKRGK